MSLLSDFPTQYETYQNLQTTYTNVENNRNNLLSRVNRLDGRRAEVLESNLEAFDQNNVIARNNIQASQIPLLHMANMLNIMQRMNVADMEPSYSLEAFQDARDVFKQELVKARAALDEAQSAIQTMATFVNN